MTTIPRPSKPPRPQAAVTEAATRTGCPVGGCDAPEGQPCDRDGAVHLARLARACRAGHVTSTEWAAVLQTAGVIFTPRTLIGGHTQAGAA